MTAPYTLNTARTAAVAVISTYQRDKHWTHWHPLPRFAAETWQWYDSEDDGK